MFVLAVKEHWLDAHAALQLDAELSGRSQTFLRLVQIDDSASALAAKKFGCILRIDLSEDATYELLLALEGLQIFLSFQAIEVLLPLQRIELFLRFESL